ncbi:coproporphyrinogen dehydrogenase HemZ [Anaerocolumna xylanovorans]|uniref:Oxygen-independent coproporphyrinogen-3 oxidase n=1 Tax=Anaerocolumna xylanovorans DSM 12503 TaxID=1121345 RepID=A0A1M7YDM6_9FIRM|nr:coproporphyrinogen dehydrogenase HemZ [Anaerocolumna xylanovorans]SHO50701.1 oxygen-independent coproporphyrinogen-3 oxidase [Anaerocolumna xylanovorans DSM 12503]
MVIQIRLNGDDYENDIYPLVKAFYPEEAVKVIRQEADRDIREESLIITVDTVDSYLCVVAEREKRQLYKEEEKVRAAKEQADFLKRKKEIRNHLKRMLYRCLKSLTEKDLPWGTLTGIRPTKIVLEKLEAGEDRKDIYRYMTEEYYCSEGKAELSLTVAERENKLLRDMDYRNGYSIYIGIPFCPSTCLYCSFTSYSIEKYGKMAEAYLEALMKEIRYAGAVLKNKKLTTLYIGGGTPTTLTEEQLERLLSCIDSYLKPSEAMEYTVEAGRPDSITEGKLKLLKAHGVNRISINPQTMQQRTLDLIGRKHTVRQIQEALLLARKTGHENINMDIIIGLPGERKEDVEDTLKEIKILNPESLTVHTLALKRASRLKEERAEYEAVGFYETSKMAGLTADFAEAERYLPYYLYRQKNMSGNLENIGYARRGREGLYNILIMEEKQTIIALGAGAQSKFVFHQENRIERVENVKSLKDYLERIDEMIDRKNRFLSENGHLL